MSNKVERAHAGSLTKNSTSFSYSHGTLWKTGDTAILILAVGGAISFFLAYNFYPEKHENVTVDGRCYGLLDAAHKQYVNLAASRDIETLRLQLSKVEPKDAIISIIFSGKEL